MLKQSSRVSARRQTVSITLEAELVAKAKAAGLNISRIAEKAIAVAVAEHERSILKEKFNRDMDAYNDYIERYGSPTEMLRAHLSKLDDAV